MKIVSCTVDTFGKVLDTGKFDLAKLCKHKVCSNRKFYISFSKDKTPITALCMTYDGNRYNISVIENNGGKHSKYKGRGKILLKYVLMLTSKKDMNAVIYLRPKNGKLVNYYKQFGFKLVNTDDDSLQMILTGEKYLMDNWLGDVK